jgi:Endodeoxyribonuclease RusA
MCKLSSCRASLNQPSTSIATPAGRLFNDLHDTGREYQWEARSQWKGTPLEADIEVSITLYLAPNVALTWTTFNKLSLDALTGIAYLDDSQIAKLTIERGYDKARPRIEIAQLGHAAVVALCPLWMAPALQEIN